MKAKICGMCKQEKLVSDFGKHKRDGYQSRCKECARRASKEYNQTPARRAYNKKHAEIRRKNGKQKGYEQRPEVKERKAAQMKEYNVKPENAIKAKARRIVRTCKENGTLTQQACSQCGRKDTQAHHGDYSKPLLIVWLCPTCHQKEKANAKEEL